MRDSDGASSDAREEDGIQPISRANGERLDGGAPRQLRAPRVSSDAPPEPLVPKTHHRPIPLRLECSKTPPSPVPRPLQAEGQQGGGYRGEILVRKTRSSERRDRSHRGRRRHRQRGSQRRLLPDGRLRRHPTKPRDPSAQRESKRAIERDRTPSFASLRAGRSTPGRARREAPR